MATECDNKDGQKVAFNKEAHPLTDEEREERERRKREAGVMRKSNAYTPVQTGAKVTKVDKEGNKTTKYTSLKPATKEEVFGKEKVDGQEAKRSVPLDIFERAAMAR